MALANDGSLFFTGYYDGELRLDAANAVQDTVAGSTQPFLAKLDQTGKPQWITNPLVYKNVPGGGSAVTIANGILAWMGRVENGALGNDTFVEIRDVKGGRDDTKHIMNFGSAINDELRSAALSPDGTTLYLAGAVNGQANAGTFNGCPAMPEIKTNGLQNIVVLAIDTASGNCLWGKIWGGGNHVAGSISVATGSDGSPFVSGFLVSGTITNIQGIQFPPVPMAPPPTYSSVGFILKLNKQTGNLFAGRGYANAQFVAMTSDPSTGTIIPSGGMGADIKFLNQTYVGATTVTDGSDNLILGFDENLNEKWALITGGPNNQFCPSISSDGAGRVYAACLTQNVIDRGANINCGSAFSCSFLLPIQSGTGALITNQIKIFGETEPFNKSGKTFVTAATPVALAVGGTWTVPVTFWDNQVLNPTGSSAMDYDIGIGKIEPLP